MTPERARKLFNYCPATGRLSWRSAAGRWGRIAAGTTVGAPCTGGHLQVRVDGRLQMVHRLAFLVATGCEPKGVIDHIDGDPTNNRLTNLRDVSQTENLQNQREAHSHSATGVLGVWQVGKRFVSKISVEGKQRLVGRFSTVDEAYSAYVNAKRELHPGCTL